jgi:hypothetical protein
MTRFVFPLDPLNTGWTAPVDPAGAPPSGCGVVWGCERPELLMTETLAFHDVRTEDLDSEPSGHTTKEMTTPDNDFDQRVPPRGSLFIELYNPWTTQTSSSAGTQGGEPAVVEAPGEFYNVNASGNSVTGGINLRATAGSSPVWRMLIVKANPATDVDIINGVTIPKDPDHYDSLKGLPPGSIERSIYFVTPSTGYLDGQQYCANSTTQVIAPLMPGRYAVIGSAGVGDGSGNYITTIGRQNQNHPVGTNDAAQDGGNNGLIAGTRRIVLSPSADLTTPRSIVYSNYATVADPPNTAYLPPMSVIIDQAVNGGVAVNRSVSVSEPVTGYLNVGTATAPNEPLMTPAVQDQPADIGNSAAPVNASVFRYVHLQRLADPTRAYDVNQNPYRTIDSAPIALTVFNGLTQAQDPGYPLPANTGLASWQRGANATGPGSMVWQFFPSIVNTASLASTAGPAHNFAFELSHSLGYLNEGFGNLQNTDTYSGSPPYGSYLGSPKTKPFSWLTWNNRPYAGSMELLLVPRSRSSRLAFDYLPPVLTPYDNTAKPGHLLPFFTSPMEFHRILNYVGVRSPFVGTETELDPIKQAMPVGSAVNTTEVSMMSYFHSPFNQVSNYREPGRININTIVNDVDQTSSSIWNGVRNQDPNDNTGPLWNVLAASRQGYTSTTITPSKMMNPVRSAAGESLVLPGDPNATNRDEVDVTLLRPTSPDSSLATDTPLLGYQSAKTYNATNIHHYFNSQTLRRLGNSLTTRSNVYAIWITVGYFEVRTTGSTGPNTPWPDGYQLWGEMGSDTGEIKRHRAFYIYDRSIPVAFERGKDHNIADGILLKRFIE